MLRKLTDSKIKAITTHPDGRPRSVSDGGGLFLHVTRNGKHWRYAYRAATGMQTLSMGSYPEISLAEARRIHEEARAMLARGIDPCAHKRAMKSAGTAIAANTFEHIARAWFERSKSGWSKSHTDRTISYLQRDVFPWIGQQHINQVTPGDVIRVVQRVEARGAGDAARRVKQYILQIYKYAVTLELADRNPAADIQNNIILKPRRPAGNTASLSGNTCLTGYTQQGISNQWQISSAPLPVDNEELQKPLVTY